MTSATRTAIDPATPETSTPDVMDLLELVVNAAVPGGLSGLDSEGALRVIEAVEAVKAWVDSVSIDATAVMVSEFETDFVAEVLPERTVVAPSTRRWTQFVRWCRSTAAHEIQVATGLPITQAQRRVWLSACEPARVAPVMDGMRLGQVTLARAMTLVEGTQHLDAYTAARIATRVLRPLTGPDGVPLPGMAPLSQATFKARLHRQLVLAHGLVGEAERTHAEAVKGRYTRAEPSRDGTGSFLVTGDGPRVAAAHERVDKIARRLRNKGDDRTLAQLRSDVALDLLMRGWIPNDPTFIQLGEPPIAMVDVVTSLTTMVGLDDAVGEIPGWGSISAEQARVLALQLGSIWTRIVTDPLTGRCIEASAKTYQVPKAMADQINARERTCRAPGCEQPAGRGGHNDHDHGKEWLPDGAGGPTAETNLAGLHRGHHNLRTSGFWDYDQDADGTLRWTMATGRHVTTYPYVYDHPDNQPIAASPLETILGRRVAAVINPDIPIPGQINIFDEMYWAQALAPTTPAIPEHQWTYEPAREQAAQEPPTASDDYPPPPF